MRAASDEPAWCGPQIVMERASSNSGAKNPSPSTWSRWRWVRTRSICSGPSARVSPSGRIPVPASRITSRPDALRTSTHDVLPPYLTVRSPGVDSEPRQPQIAARTVDEPTRSALLELPHPARHRLEQRPGDLGGALDERLELPLREAVRGAVARRRDRGRPQPAVDQRDLAEVVARPERAPLLPLDRHLRGPRLEHEEPGAAQPLGRQLLPVAEAALRELAGQAPELSLGQVLEEGDALQELDRGGHREATAYRPGGAPTAPRAGSR